MSDQLGLQERTGGCLCGAVRYRVAGALRPVVICHCTQCRRMTGHVMAATAAKRADFCLLADRELRWFASSDKARRGFCGRCGSTLFWDGVGRDFLSIAVGSLDNTEGLEIVGHIFVADKGAYYAINDSALQIMDGSFSVPLPPG